MPRKTKSARARELSAAGVPAPEIAKRLKLSRQAVHVAQQREDRVKARKGVERLQVAIDAALLKEARARAECDGIRLAELLERALRAEIER